jgi:hypothetical protein
MFARHAERLRAEITRLKLRAGSAGPCSVSATVPEARLLPD